MRSHSGNHGDSTANVNFYRQDQPQHQHKHLASTVPSDAALSSREELLQKYRSSSARCLSSQTSYHYRTPHYQELLMEEEWKEPPQHDREGFQNVVRDDLNYNSHENNEESGETQMDGVVPSTWMRHRAHHCTTPSSPMSSAHSSLPERRRRRHTSSSPVTSADALHSAVVTGNSETFHFPTPAGVLSNLKPEVKSDSNNDSTMRRPSPIVMKVRGPPAGYVAAPLQTPPSSPPSADVSAPPPSSHAIVSSLQLENVELRSKWLQSEEEKNQLVLALRAQEKSFRLYQQESQVEVERWKAKSKALAERLAAELFSPVARSTTRERSSSETGTGATPTRGVPAMVGQTRVDRREEHAGTTLADGNDGSLFPQDDACSGVMDTAGGWGKCREEVAFLIRSQEEERAFTMDILNSVLKDLGITSEPDDEYVDGRVDENAAVEVLQKENSADGMKLRENSKDKMMMLPGDPLSPSISKSEICRLLARVSLGMQSQSAEWTRRLSYWCSRVQQHITAVEEVEETLREGPLRLLFEQYLSNNNGGTDNGITWRSAEKPHTEKKAPILSHLLDFSFHHFQPLPRARGGENEHPNDPRTNERRSNIPQWKSNTSYGSTTTTTGGATGRIPHFKIGFTPNGSFSRPEENGENSGSPGVASTPVGRQRASVSESSSSAPSAPRPTAAPTAAASTARTSAASNLNDLSAMTPQDIAAHASTAGGSFATGCSIPQTPFRVSPAQSFKAAKLTRSSSTQDEAVEWCCDVLKACVRGLQGVRADLLSFHADIVQQPALLSSQYSTDAVKQTSPAFTSTTAKGPIAVQHSSQPLYDRLSNELLALKQRSFELQEKLLRRFSREEQLRQEVAAKQDRRLQRVSLENRRLAALMTELEKTSRRSPHRYRIGRAQSASDVSSIHSNSSSGSSSRRKGGVHDHHRRHSPHREAATPVAVPDQISRSPKTSTQSPKPQRVNATRVPERDSMEHHSHHNHRHNRHRVVKQSTVLHRASDEKPAAAKFTDAHDHLNNSLSSLCSTEYSSSATSVSFHLGRKNDNAAPEINTRHSRQSSPEKYARRGKVPKAKGLSDGLRKGRKARPHQGGDHRTYTEDYTEDDIEQSLSPSPSTQTFRTERNINAEEEKKQRKKTNDPTWTSSIPLYMRKQKHETGGEMGGIEPIRFDEGVRISDSLPVNAAYRQPSHEKNPQHEIPQYASEQSRGPSAQQLFPSSSSRAGDDDIDDINQRHSRKKAIARMVPLISPRPPRSLK